MSWKLYEMLLKVISCKRRGWKPLRRFGQYSRECNLALPRRSSPSAEPRSLSRESASKADAYFRQLLPRKELPQQPRCAALRGYGNAWFAVRVSRPDGPRNGNETVSHHHHQHPDDDETRCERDQRLSSRPARRAALFQRCRPRSALWLFLTCFRLPYTSLSVSLYFFLSTSYFLPAYITCYY